MKPSARSDWIRGNNYLLVKHGAGLLSGLPRLLPLRGLLPRLKRLLLSELARGSLSGRLLLLGHLLYKLLLLGRTLPLDLLRVRVRLVPAMNIMQRKRKGATQPKTQKGIEGEGRGRARGW